MAKKKLLIYSRVVQDLFHSTYLDRKKDLAHMSMQIEKPLAEQNCDGSVDKFDSILVEKSLMVWFMQRLCMNLLINNRRLLRVLNYNIDFQNPNYFS